MYATIKTIMLGKTVDVYASNRNGPLGVTVYVDEAMVVANENATLLIQAMEVANMVAELFTDRTGVVYIRANGGDASIARVAGKDDWAIQVNVRVDEAQPPKIISASFGDN